jgi:hypothetical protein
MLLPEGPFCQERIKNISGNWWITLPLKGNLSETIHGNGSVLLLGKKKN